jgi:class 3 adenylate cyclase
MGRLIRFDKRGTGLSDRPLHPPDLETRMDDLRAVMDAAGSRQATVLGYSEGGPLAVLFATAHPERVDRLVLYGTYAKRTEPDDDYPWAQALETRKARIAAMEADWGPEANLRDMCPSADEELARWWGARARAAASPGAVRALMEMNSMIDVRDLLSTVQAPTLVVHRTGDRAVLVEEGRYIAARIPDARLLELPGVDHFVAIDPDQIVDAIEPFVTGGASTPPPAPHEPPTDRVLATILLTDIVSSTETAVRLGDRAWAALLDEHHALVREEVTRFRGEEVDAVGDGFLALFDGPARAIRCADAITRRVRTLGLNVRAGVHTGEIERVGKGARGIAIHVAARVSAEAGPGQVLVSATTSDLIAGSGLVLDDLGERALKGLDGPRRLFALRS